MLVMALTAVAQGKLTPQAQLTLAKHKKELASRKDAKAPSLNGARQETMMRLIVKVEADRKAETLQELLKRGARVEGLLGQQAVICLPIDSVECISEIKGVVRINAGGKGHLKTDVSRHETGVNLLNGPDVSPLGDELLPLTGAGITICFIDMGFDYQHPTFKRADGTSRIKCVYDMMGEDGQKFRYNNPEWGNVETELPGCVYDTPEQIAALTTDNEDEQHGTHTASTAAGTLSPMGFGGMAPEADIVLVPFGEVMGEGGGADIADEYTLTAIAFADAYARQSKQPVVLSGSVNSHGGPHDGTSPISQAIASASRHLIPIFSAGNEGDEKVYLHHDFTASQPRATTFFSGSSPDETEEYMQILSGYVNGYLYGMKPADELTIEVALFDIDSSSQTWRMGSVKYHLGDELQPIMVTSDDDTSLSQMFDGDINLAINEDEQGRIAFFLKLEGGTDESCAFILTVTAPEGTSLSMWNDAGGFKGADVALDGTNDCSAGDWTSTPDLISVGAYCANTLHRSADGDINDTSGESSMDFQLHDIASFSSYGQMPNGVNQPTICAPGTNIVAAVNQYAYDLEEVVEQMMWQGYPYDALDGTSMSCPTVSGIVALWLQACPTLTLSQIKEIMEYTSRTDSFTASHPIRWGYGKIDAKAGIDYIQQHITGIEQIADKPQARPIATYYDLSGRRLTKPGKGISIHQGRKVVRQ